MCKIKQALDYGANHKFGDGDVTRLFAEALVEYDKQHQAPAGVDEDAIKLLLTDSLIDGLMAWNPETVNAVYDIFRPYLTQPADPLDLEVCARAIRSQVDSIACNGYRPYEFPEKAALRIAKAVLTAANVKWKE